MALVPRGWPRPRALGTIGAAFVDTHEGRDALRAAHALARRSGARLRVLAAVLPRAWMGDGTPEGLDAAAEDARLRAGAAAEAAAGNLLGAAVDVDVEVLEPAAWLVEASREVDVLVCGARGYGARPVTLLCGVTRALTAGASCSVVVLSRGAEVPLERVFESGSGAVRPHAIIEGGADRQSLA